MKYERLNDALADIQATPRDSTTFPALLFTFRDADGAKCAVRDLAVTDIPLLMDVDAVREIAAYMTGRLGTEATPEFGHVNVPVKEGFKGDVGDVLDKYKDFCNLHASVLLERARDERMKLAAS